jgi:hypothetical protein
LETKIVANDSFNRFGQVVKWGFSTSVLMYMEIRKIIWNDYRNA